METETISGGDAVSAGGSVAGAYTSGTIVMAVSKAEYGNKCHVECSNRGLCDNKVGVCACFRGFHGNACQLQDALAVI